jgi:hypothetical protein
MLEPDDSTSEALWIVQATAATVRAIFGPFKRDGWLLNGRSYLPFVGHPFLYISQRRHPGCSFKNAATDEPITPIER